MSKKKDKKIDNAKKEIRTAVNNFVEKSQENQKRFNALPLSEKVKEMPYYNEIYESWSKTKHGKTDDYLDPTPPIDNEEWADGFHRCWYNNVTTITNMKELERYRLFEENTPFKAIKRMSEHVKYLEFYIKQMHHEVPKLYDMYYSDDNER